MLVLQVTDPVQLVCSKGGDLTLLRAVASLDYTEDSSDIPCMLEQRDTLRMAMSKPQVGFRRLTPSGTAVGGWVNTIP